MTLRIIAQLKLLFVGFFWGVILTYLYVDGVRNLFLSITQSTTYTNWQINNLNRESDLFHWLDNFNGNNVSKRVGDVSDRDFLHNYAVLLNHPRACNMSDNVTLLIGVITSPSDITSRRAIRATWGSERWKTNGKDVVVILYFLGMTNNIMVQEMIEEEDREYGDIIQHSYVDSYDNLTIKSVALLEWSLKFCSGAKYLLKSDTDMFINVPNLLSYVEEYGTSRDLVGSILRDRQPIRNVTHKWYARGYPSIESKYPTYASGPAYAMSSDTARLLYHASFHIRFFVMEDVYLTGLCAQLAGIHHQHYPRMFRLFKYHKEKATLCTYNTIIAMHYIEPHEMEDIFQFLTNSSHVELLCNLEKMSSKST